MAGAPSDRHPAGSCETRRHPSKPPASEVGPGVILRERHESATLETAFACAPKELFTVVLNLSSPWRYWSRRTHLRRWRREHDKRRLDLCPHVSPYTPPVSPAR